MRRSSFIASLLVLASAIATTGVCQTQDISSATGEMDAQQRFQALDADHDGLLSKYEYDSDVLMAVADANRDGLVSPQELEQALGPQSPGTKSMASRMVAADIDRDGQLNEDELRNAMELRFKWLDRNADGNLDLEEMRAGYGVRVRP